MIRNKVFAVVLGPTGVGLFAQMLGLQNLAVGIVPLGMETGALRHIAMYRAHDPAQLPRFVHTASRVFLWLSLAATGLCFLFLAPLTEWATDSTAYMSIMIPPILGIPFLVQGHLWLVYVQAGLDVRAYSRALVLTAVLSLLLFIPLVLVWRLKGASVYLFAAAVIAFLMARIFANRVMDRPTRQAVRTASYDPRAATTLFHFAGANVLPFALTLTFPFILRAQIVQDLGLTQNGIYQALFLISTQYLAIPLNAMTAYSLPRISQMREVGDINREVNHAVRVAVLFSTAGILVILLLRDVVVRALFSDRFLAAVPLFPVQMVGDLFKAIAFAVQLPLLPQARYRARNVLAIVQYGVFAAVFFAVPPALRLQGAVWGHLASWSVHLVAHVAYLARVNGFRFSGDNTRLLATSLAAVIAVAALPFPDPAMRLVGIGIAAAWAATCVTSGEVRQVMQAIRSRLERESSESGTGASGGPTAPGV